MPPKYTRRQRAELDEQEFFGQDADESEGKADSAQHEGHRIAGEQQDGERQEHEDGKKLGEIHQASSLPVVPAKPSGGSPRMPESP